MEGNVAKKVWQLLKSLSGEDVYEIPKRGRSFAVGAPIKPRRIPDSFIKAMREAGVEEEFVKWAVQQSESLPRTKPA